MRTVCLFSYAFVTVSVCISVLQISNRARIHKILRSQVRNLNVPTDYSSFFFLAIASHVPGSETSPRIRLLFVEES